MRLALMETKMTLIEIVRQFRILPAPETKVRTSLLYSLSLTHAHTHTGMHTHNRCSFLSSSVIGAS